MMNGIQIEGVHYPASRVEEVAKCAFGRTRDFKKQLVEFLREWFDDKPELTVKTSGSTGVPKLMYVRKEHMVNSARITCSFLGLKRGDRALLCLPLEYIAGKMMVVRAIVVGLDLHLVTPTAHPLRDIDADFDFAAMIPMQVYNSLSENSEAIKLEKISNLIIGGGAIDLDLEHRLASISTNNIYSTYGMTETLSHIALRRINGRGASAYYIPFPSVAIRLSDEQTLVINAPLVCETELQTNDIAEINSSGGFRILGRKDNVINSGGVKIQIEQEEERLQSFVFCPFAITSVPHKKYGEVVVMLVETDKIDEKLRKVVSERLQGYALPKEIIAVEKLPITPNGKKSRIEIAKLARRTINIDVLI